MLFATCGVACGAPPPAPAPAAARPTAPVAVPALARDDSSRLAGPLDAGSAAAPEAKPVGEQNPPAHHAPWSIDSPCVDVSADVSRRLRGASAHEVLRWDLDLDGENDWVVVVESQPEKWRARGWVYLARGACGHFAAEWSGGLPQPGGEGEILVVEEPCKDPVLMGADYRCCPKTTYWRYFWDGKRSYRRRDTFTESRACGVRPL